MKNTDLYIYGRNALIEALKSKKDIEKIYITFGAKGKAIDSIFALSKKNKVSIVKYDNRKFSSLERKNLPQNVNSQGVIALMRKIDLLSVDELVNMAFSKEENPVIIILDEINDPHNLGAIARSAECCGAAGMIITERNTAPLSPAAIKSSAGALEHIPIARTGSLPATLKDLKNYGLWVIGTDSEADNIYTDDLYKRPVALIVGSEGKGMRPSTKKHCDLLVKIPMRGYINSLNASVSAAVIMFEIVRQRNENQ